MSGPWKPGFPPKKYYEGMVDDYEVAFAPLERWHRRRTTEEKAAYIEACERNKASLMKVKS